MALQGVPAELLPGSRAGDRFPPTDGQGKPAEAVCLHRRRKAGENPLVNSRLKGDERKGHHRATCRTGRAPGPALWLQALRLTLVRREALWRHLQDGALLGTSAAVRSDAGAAALLASPRLQIQKCVTARQQVQVKEEASYRRGRSGGAERLWIAVSVVLLPQHPHTVSRLGHTVRLLQHCNNNNSQAVT